MWLGRGREEGPGRWGVGVWGVERGDRGGGGKGRTGVCKYPEKWGEGGLGRGGPEYANTPRKGGLGRGGPEYANTPRNGGKGGWEGEDRSMQIPRGREYANTPWEIVMCRYSWRGCIAKGWGVCRLGWGGGSAVPSGPRCAFSRSEERGRGGGGVRGRYNIVN